jgi:arsenate reductase
LGAFLGRASVKVAIVVCASAEAACPRLYPFAARVLYWPFDDPVEARSTPEAQIAAFRRVRDAIDARVRQFLIEGA